LEGVKMNFLQDMFKNHKNFGKKVYSCPRDVPDLVLGNKYSIPVYCDGVRKNAVLVSFSEDVKDIKETFAGFLINEMPEFLSESEYVSALSDFNSNGICFQSFCEEWENLIFTEEQYNYINSDLTWVSINYRYFNQIKNTKENVMNTRNKVTASGVGNALKKNAKDAAWRQASRKASKGATVVITKAVSGLGNNQSTKMLTEFLKTPDGQALVGLLVGMAPVLAPNALDNPHVERLADEMRTNAFDHFYDKVGEELFAPLFEVLKNSVSNIK
jgi:hypothetical protein